MTAVHDLALSPDKGTEMHAAVLDFSGASDLVPHHILIDKFNIDFSKMDSQLFWQVAIREWL